MDAGTLKIFQAVAQEGSISKAALKLNYVQSNVSARIRQLEEELQVCLFERSSRGMSITSAGESLLGYADQILLLLHEAELATRGKQETYEVLRLGSIETSASGLLTPLLAQLRIHYPDVQHSLVTGANHALIQKVLCQELQGALVYGPVEQSEVEYIRLYDDELVLAAERGAGDLMESLQRPMLFFEVGCAHQASVNALMLENGIDNPVVVDYGTLDTIRNGVSAGLGVSLLPRSSVSKLEERGELSLISLPDRYRSLEVGFVYSRSECSTGALRMLISLMNRMHDI
ncbi:LysR family transcriptional regulator [Paenibacillus sp. 1P07SE]|uniref:LysR family transcriptional regulator n=1 Tax=Paenibacillus sp. 1P07SE TaxID=3132209 RepID=UPI0039A4D47C